MRESTTAYISVKRWMHSGSPERLADFMVGSQVGIGLVKVAEIIEAAYDVDSGCLRLVLLPYDEKKPTPG